MARTSLAALLLLTPFLATCGSVLDLCPPVDGRVGFFSRGDCVFTRGSFFAGHEWVTYFGNDAIDPADRFSESEIGYVVEGNRRTDFPLEMLVHLNTSVLAYTNAVVEYQDRPENQAIHFLLRADSRTPAAKEEAEALMLAKSKEAVRLWSTERIRALTLIGQVCHTIQDSYSPAHVVRRPTANGSRCIDVMKSFVTRSPGFEMDYKGRPAQFHGGDETTNIGHTTTEDSIYREGRDCHTPRSAQEVRDCLSDDAQAAVDGTTDYLAAIHDLVVNGASEDAVDAALADYFARRFAFCPD